MKELTLIKTVTPVMESSLRKHIENLKKKKLTSSKIVSLDDFREMRLNKEAKTVLVVDDDEVMRAAIKRILESENYKVLLAEDGVALSKMMESFKIDLILLDINLPWVDGFELCSLIKGNKNLVHIPIIMVSAYKTEDDIEKGFASGADEYISKPFEVDHMISVIEKNLRTAS